MPVFRVAILLIAEVREILRAQIILYARREGHKGLVGILSIRARLTMIDVDLVVLRFLLNFKQHVLVIM
jgi:hypothetical protein